MLADTFHDWCAHEYGLGYAQGYRDAMRDARVALDHDIAEAIDPGPAVSTIMRLDVQAVSAKAVVEALVARMDRSRRPAPPPGRGDHPGGPVDFETGQPARLGVAA